MDDFLAFRYVQIISLSNYFKSIFKTQLDLISAYQFFGLNLFSPKKLLGPGAGGSTRTVINPI